MAKISISKLEKEYKNNKVLAIDELNFDANEIVGLVGNNGAGKTTLLRLMLDLINPTNGYVSINYEHVNQSGEWKKIVASFIDQSFLLDFMKPSEYFYFLGNAYGVSKAEIGDRLKMFEDFFNGEILSNNTKLIRDLSSGNKQKVGIAGVLITHPQVILLDEPFNALDPTSQIQFRNLITQYHGQHKAISIISSHDLNHITEISNRIVLLEKGTIVQDQAVNTDTLSSLQHYFEQRL